MGKLFQNPGRVVVGIVIFVLVFILLLAIAARADAADLRRQDIALELGSAMLRGETPTLGFNVACKLCGPVDTDYEYGFELIGSSTNHVENSNVIQLHAQIVDGWKRAELGLGFFWLNVDHEYTCRWGFHLLARWRFTERIAAQWRHSSSAGSCKPNAGRDLLTVSWAFGKASR